MQTNTRRFIAIIAIGSGLMLTYITAFAEEAPPLKSLSAQWVQWALSIPTPVNPQLDTTGEDCMVGQSGSIWFLAGVAGGGTATRSCSVPADKVLFFPVANQSYFNSPGVCGDENRTVRFMRDANRAFVDGITRQSVKVDGQRVATPRIQSIVFAVALPEDNIFDAPCMAAGLGNVPAGIYSPAVDDGFYAILRPLQPGTHTVAIKAEGANSFSEDVTYNLTVVPVTLQ